MRIVLPALILALAACNTGTPEAPRPDPAPAKTAAPVNAANKKLRAPITQKPVALSELAKNPHAFAGKDVATTGKVIAVCQSMGCWMELQDESGQAHVKMAGHNFF